LSFCASFFLLEFVVLARCRFSSCFLPFLPFSLQRQSSERICKLVEEIPVADGAPIYVVIQKLHSLRKLEPRPERRPGLCWITLILFGVAGAYAFVRRPHFNPISNI
jgi:hypothetical protein